MAALGVAAAVLGAVAHRGAGNMKQALTRLMRHLLMTPMTLKRRFPVEVMRRITSAITASELTHRGQIRFAIELNLPLRDIVQKKSARQRALEVFSELGVWDTEENNGILIYLLLAERDFEIVADRGICRQVDQDSWQRVSHEMETLFRQGQFEAGVLHGITQVGILLHRYYPLPKSPSNELPDSPVIL